MSTIYVDPQKLNRCSGQFSSMSGAMRRDEQVVTSVSSKLGMQIRSKPALVAALKRVSDQILTEAAAMDTLSDALSYISAKYIETEQQILGRDFSDGMQSTTNADDKSRNAFDEFIEWFTQFLISIGLIKAKHEPVTTAQERAMDRYMQNEIAKLQSQEKYTEAYWNQASAAERKEILASYIKEISRIMGLPETEIHWTNTEPQNGFVNRGAYSSTTDTININEWILSSGDANGFSSYKSLSTVVHEMRHRYQHYAINHPENFKVSDQTLQTWQESFDNYKTREGFMRQGMSSDDAYNAYRNQAVEVDARRFAGQS